MNFFYSCCFLIVVVSYFWCDGFFLACKEFFARMFNQSFPHLGISISFSSFFEVEISLHTLISLFMPRSVHNGSSS